MNGRAQTDWNPVLESSENSKGEQPSGPNHRWDAVPQSQNTKPDLVWELLLPAQGNIAPEGGGCDVAIPLLMSVFPET